MQGWEMAKFREEKSTNSETLLGEVRREKFQVAYIQMPRPEHVDGR
jgi:hypothetical protein